MWQCKDGGRQLARPAGRQSGQAMLEFILILPLLLIVVAAVWEYGRVFDAELIATNAAREGARFASTNTQNTDLTQQTRNRVVEYLYNGYASRLSSVNGSTSYTYTRGSGSTITFNPSGDVAIAAITVAYLDASGASASGPAPEGEVQVMVQGTVRVFMPFLPGLVNSSTPNVYQMSTTTTMLLQ